MRKPVLLFGSIALFPLALLVACGGSNAASPGAASPANAAGSSAPSGASGASPSDTSAASAASPGAPTTTTALPDGGELQGAKLEEKHQSAGATFDVDAGPARGPHQQEPGRSPKDIQTIIQAHRDEARACYDRVQQQKGDPNLKGNLDVVWKIDPTGAVTEISIDDAKSDIHDKDIGACVMGIIKGIHFAVSGKGYETRAHYPFNFNPHTFAPRQPKPPQN